MQKWFKIVKYISIFVTFENSSSAKLDFAARAEAGEYTVLYGVCGHVVHLWDWSAGIMGGITGMHFSSLSLELGWLRHLECRRKVQLQSAY